MKTNGTRILFIAIFLYFFLLLASFSSFAQPDYNFSNGSKIAGVDRQVNAQYRFTNVKTGVDAIVTITALTNGVTLNSVDGSSGFAEAFQPAILVPAMTTGYAEFVIDFVAAGTSTPAVMLEVPVTCIDVDGRISSGLPIYEFDMIRRSTGMYTDFDMLGGELTVNFDPTWVTGTNAAAVDYPGVDTLAKQAMFSSVSANISSLTIRVGAINLTNTSQQRLRSVYFKKFTYANSFLPKAELISFRGIEKNERVELQWELEANNQLSTVTVEKASGEQGFTSIAAFWISNEIKTPGFRFTDPEAVSGNSVYRLKLTSMDGRITYSNQLAFRKEIAAGKGFKIYPSIVQSSATLQLQAASASSARFELVDYTGRVLQRQHIQLQSGQNNIQLSNLNAVSSGNYLAVVKVGTQTFTQKLIKK